MAIKSGNGILVHGSAKNAVDIRKIINLKLSDMNKMKFIIKAICKTKFKEDNNSKTKQNSEEKKMSDASINAMIDARKLSIFPMINISVD